MTFRPFSRTRPSRAVLLAGVLLPLLAACNIDKNEIVGSIPDDYRTRHPIVIEEGLATLDVPVGIGQGSLNDGVRSTVAGFAQGYRSSGATMITVVAPVGSPNQNAAAATAGQVRQALQAAGIPGNAIEMRSYRAGPKEANAAVRIAYSRVTAKTNGTCGRWSDQSSVTSENRNYSNFGCATQQNTAAMLANPMDLMYPREMAPPDAERRGVMLEKYRQAEQPIQSNTNREGNPYIARGVGQ